MNHNDSDSVIASNGALTTTRRAVLAIGAAATFAAPAQSQIGGAAPERANAAENRITARTRIATDTVLSADQIIAAEGGFEIADGVKLTLTGDLVAPARRIFFGPGRVDLMRSSVIAARPEWWGAIADDPQTDCLPALSACLAAHISMQLGAGDYLISDTLDIALPNRRVQGVGRVRDARATRLVLLSATGVVMRAGVSKTPRGINDYVQGLDVRWLILGRSIAPAPAAAAATGLVITHVLDCVFEGIRTDEHSIGFQIGAAVRTFVRDCTAFRGLSTGDVAQASFIGFDMAGATPGLPGTNASLYLVDCLASTGRPPLAMSIGARLKGAIADTFLIRFETAAVTDGIVIEGDSVALGAARARSAHVNVSIQAPVLDGCLRSGIAISGLSDHSAVALDNPYVALAPEGTVALSVRNCRGNLDIAGGQLLGGPAFGKRVTTGLLIDDVEGVVCTRTRIMGFARPVDVRAAAGFELTVAVSSRLGATGQPAIRLADCRRGYVRPLIAGEANAHTAGVAIGGSVSALTIETVGIDAATVDTGVTRNGGTVAPAGNRVVIDA